VVGWLVVIMSLAVIGVHGMLSGTASMDFGGKKNVGIAVGIIDGFVYLGTAAMSFTYAIILPQEQFDEAGKLTWVNAAYAAAVGADACLIEGIADMRALDIKALFSKGKPTVLDVRIDPEEVPPINSRVRVLTGNN